MKLTSVSFEDHSQKDGKDHWINSTRTESPPNDYKIKMFKTLDAIHLLTLSDRALWIFKAKSITY